MSALKSPNVYVAVSDSCLNRYMPYECNEKICGVGTECSNRAFSNLRGGLADLEC
jgi:hypothetical protein